LVTRKRLGVSGWRSSCEDFAGWMTYDFFRTIE
jgi:hypothetical protein